MKANIELHLINEENGTEQLMSTPMFTLSDSEDRDEFLKKCTEILETSGMGALMYLEHWLTHQPVVSAGA